MWCCRVLLAPPPAPYSATLSPALLVYLCANVGPRGLLVVGLPAPLVPHSASLGPAMATGVLSTPVLVSTPPTGLDVCFLFIYLVSDFLALRFSVSSGCARRRSVSAYTTILVLQRENLKSRKGETRSNIQGNSDKASSLFLNKNTISQKRMARNIPSNGKQRPETKTTLPGEALN